jgi:predicted nucleic acid-binding protein
MVIADFYNKEIFLDTAPLIYFIEGHSPYEDSLKRIFEANNNFNFTFITSTITLLEVLVKPLKEGELNLAERYQDILTKAQSIEIFDVTNSISVKAAELRAKYNLRTPDAIQVATAIENNAAYFFTNDMRLKSIVEVKIAVLSEFK